MKTLIPPVIFITVLLLFFAACKDDDRPEFPDVEFLSPSRGANYEVFDTIDVQIRISSSAAGANLSLSLVNDQDINVLPALATTDLETGKTYNFKYPLTLKSLSSGYYHLKAEATANGQKGKEYLQVYIIELEKQLEEIWLVTQPVQDQMRVLSGSPAGTAFTGVIDYPGTYGGSGMSSLHEMFFLGASWGGDLGAFDTGNHQMKWEIQAVQNPQQPYFTLVDYHNNLLYAGLYEGQVRGWTMAGQPAFATTTNINTIPVMVYPYEEYLILVTRQKSNETIYRLEIFYSGNGNLHLSQVIDFQPLVFSVAEPGKLLMMGNTPEATVAARLLDPGDGHVGEPYQPFNLPENEMLAGAAVSEGRVLYACTDGIYLYEYQYASGMIADISGISTLAYEPLSQLILAAGGSTLYRLSLNGQIMGQTNIGEEIKNIHFLYNR